MKKVLIVAVALIAILSLGIFTFADDISRICGLSDESYEEMKDLKIKVIEEKVADGTITKEEGDEWIEAIKNDDFHGRGFGYLMRDSEYSDDMYKIMEKEGRGFGRSRGRGCRN